MRLDGRKHTSLSSGAGSGFPTATIIFRRFLRKKPRPRKSFPRFSDSRKTAGTRPSTRFPRNGSEARSRRKASTFGNRPVGIPKGRRFHLSVRDLADLHAKLREIGGDDIQAVTTLSRDSASDREGLDPRTPFRNRTAVIILTILIVAAAAAGPAVQILDFKPPCSFGRYNPEVKKDRTWTSRST